MKTNDEVKILNGYYAGETAYFLDHPIGRSDVANIQLKNGMRKVQVFTSDLEVVNQEEVNDYFKRINLEWKTVNIHPNDSKETEQVHISTAKDGFTLKGREQIEEFIRAVAISGDLIGEEEELVVEHKIEFVAPEDGTYQLVVAGVHLLTIFVINGACYTVSSGTGLPYDATKYVKVKVEKAKGLLRKLDVTGQW